MWVLVMVLVGYGSNDKRLRVWEKVDWRFTIPIANFFIRDYYVQYNQYVEYNHFMSPRHKEPVTVSTVTTVCNLRKKG